MNICWITIHVKDLEASKKFYGDFLGLTLERSFSPGPGMTIVFYQDEQGLEIELIHQEGAKESATIPVTIGIRSAAFRDLLKKAPEKGISILSGPVTLGPDCTCFFVQDPDGVGVQIIKE